MPNLPRAEASYTGYVYGRSLLFEEDGVERGGVEIPEFRDRDYSVTIILKPGTVHTTGLHWHEKKTEYLQVLQGHALVTVGDKTGVFGPDDGVITVPRFTLHQYGRADTEERGAVSKNIELRMKEWTSPPDARKEVFFRNIIGVLNTRKAGYVGTMELLLFLVAVMREHDNYAVFTRGPSLLGNRGRMMVCRATTYMVLGCVGFFSWLLGYRGTQERFTPPELIETLQRA